MTCKRLNKSYLNFSNNNKKKPSYFKKGENFIFAFLLSLLHVCLWYKSVGGHTCMGTDGECSDAYVRM